MPRSVTAGTELPCVTTTGAVMAVVLVRPAAPAVPSDSMVVEDREDRAEDSSSLFVEIPSDGNPHCQDDWPTLTADASPCPATVLLLRFLRRPSEDVPAKGAAAVAACARVSAADEKLTMASSLEPKDGYVSDLPLAALPTPPTP